MQEITKETVINFVDEYKQLCTKYNLYVAANQTDYLGLFKVSTNLADFEFWCSEWLVQNVPV